MIAVALTNVRTFIVVVAIVLGMLLALIPAKIARNKGQSFITWWFYGFLLWPVACDSSLPNRVIDHAPIAPK
jgi:hypothetical protein